MERGSPAHLHRRCDAARRDEDEEPDVPGPRRRERRDPRALAKAPKADASGVDLAPGGERTHGGEGVACLVLEPVREAGPSVVAQHRDPHGG